MARFVQVDTTGIQNIIGRVASGKAVFANPFLEGRGSEAVKIMRTGTKGVAQQFRDSTEYRGNVSAPWRKSSAFGEKPAPRKTMIGSGLYRSAWLGGSGSLETVTKDSVSIGVDSGLYPQVKIHQGRRKTVTIKPTVAMRWFLGFTYGVWLSRKKMRSGIKIERRRVSVSADVRKAVAKMLKRAAGKAFRAPRLSTAGSK